MEGILAIDMLTTTARSRSVLAVVCIVSVLAAGCGSGSGGGDTPVEVLLAVGEEFGAPLPFGGRVSRPVVMRKVGEDPWAEVEGPQGIFLRGVVFSSPDTVWGFGVQDTGLALVRSDDRGQSWRDVTATLPPLGGTALLFDLIFADEHTGYLAVRFSPYGPAPLIYVTRDAGASWNRVEVRTVPFGGERVNLLARDGAIELLRSDDGRAYVEPIDGTPSLPQVLAQDGTVGSASSAATVGARGWAAVTVETDPVEIAPLPAIFSSVAPGEPWIEQPIEATGFVRLRTLDMCSASTGVASGREFGPSTRRPIILHTVPDGTRWIRSVIDGVTSETTIRGILCTRNESAWAITIDPDDDDGIMGSSFLHSTDGGATWALASTSLANRTQLRGLARSTERE